MAYELHIERGEEGIALEEWNAAVESVPGVRAQTEDLVGINPKTGAEIRIGRAEGDAELLVTSGESSGIDRQEEWIPFFRYFEGRITFRATRDVDSPESAVRMAAARLAAQLNAGIVGDEGESYEW